MSGKDNPVFTTPAPDVPKKQGPWLKIFFALVAAVALLWAFFRIPAVQEAVSVANRWVFLEQKAQELESNNRLLKKKIEELQEENAELAEKVPVEPEEEHSRLEEMGKLAEKVKTALLEVTPEQSFEMEHSENGITVRIWQDTLFPLDSTYVHPQGRRILEKIMQTLSGLKKGMSLDVEAHSDSTPLRASMKGRFETTREMSASRAVNTVNVFERAEFLPGSKLCAIGWGESKPLSPEDMEEALAKNRRVELIFSWGLNFAVPENE